MRADSCEHTTCYTNTLQREVTLWYLCDTGSKNTRLLTFPKAHNKQGKTELETTAISFSTLYTGQGITAPLHCAFPLNLIRISVYNFPYFICI